MKQVFIDSFGSEYERNILPREDVESLIKELNVEEIVREMVGVHNDMSRTYAFFDASVGGVFIESFIGNTYFVADGGYIPIFTMEGPLEENLVVEDFLTEKELEEAPTDVWEYIRNLKDYEDRLVEAILFYFRGFDNEAIERKLNLLYKPNTFYIMKTSYFTFGQSHVHTLNGTTLDKDCIVRITDRNPRKKMFDLFGDKFASEYDIEILDATYFPRRIFPISQDNSILPYTSFWHIKEFKDGDHFASFVIDVLLDRGLEVGDTFIENFPLFYEERGRDLIDVLNEGKSLMDPEIYPNFLKYETVRGWCYDIYNLRIEDHSSLAPTFPLQILSIEGEFDLVDSIVEHQNTSV